MLYVCDSFSKAPKKAKICQLCTVILSGNYNDLEGRKICPLFYVTWNMSSFLVMDILPWMEVKGRLYFYGMCKPDMLGTSCKSN